MPEPSRSQLAATDQVTQSVVCAPPSGYGAAASEKGEGGAMKLVSFAAGSEERLGLLAGEVVVDPLLASGNRAMFASALA